MAFPLIPVLGAVGSAVSAGLSSLQSSKDRQQSRQNVQDTIRHQKEMADLAYSRDLEMWNRANLYNHPTQQMERMRKAGINPRLIYGNQSVTGNIATTLPKYQAPRPDYSGRRNPVDISQFAGVLSQFQNFALNDAQIDNVKSMTDLNKEKKATETFNALLRNFQGLDTKAKSEMSQTFANYYADYLKLQMRGMRARANKDLQSLRSDMQRERLLKATTRKVGLSSEISALDLQWLNTMKGNQLLRTITPMLRYILK